MSRPSSTQTTPQFYRVSDRDLTEIELHSVDSINDLHRTHPEHSHKGKIAPNTPSTLQRHIQTLTLTLNAISGMRPPRPAYTPSPNGNIYTCDTTVANQRGHPGSKSWQSRLQDMLMPSSSRAYAMGCAIITLLLLTVLLIFYFLGEIKKKK